MLKGAELQAPPGTVKNAGISVPFKSAFNTIIRTAVSANVSVTGALYEMRIFLKKELFLPILLL